MRLVLGDVKGLSWSCLGLMLAGFVSVLLAMLGKGFILSYIPAPDLKLKDSRSSETEYRIPLSHGGQLKPPQLSSYSSTQHLSGREG